MAVVHLFLAQLLSAPWTTSWLLGFHRFNSETARDRSFSTTRWLRMGESTVSFFSSFRPDSAQGGVHSYIASAPLQNECGVRRTPLVPAGGQAVRAKSRRTV